MSEQEYNGKPLSSYDLWELGLIEQSLKQAEAKRNEAAKHPKFDKNNSKNVGAFPAPNPEFLKLKTAIEEEIRKRNKMLKHLMNGSSLISLVLRDADNEGGSSAAELRNKQRAELIKNNTVNASDEKKEAVEADEEDNQEGDEEGEEEGEEEDEDW
jgi:hypothetical protein